MDNTWLTRPYFKARYERMVYGGKGNPPIVEIRERGCMVYPKEYLIHLREQDLKAKGIK